MIILSLGSNLSSSYGDRFYNLDLAISYLENYNIQVIKKSSYYETPSYPDKNLPEFVNVGILVEVDFDYFDLLKRILLIEKKIGRIRSNKNDPRVCDIDIIDFNGCVKKAENLELPHPRCHQRNFVLYPIKEINSKWIHPVLRKNVDFLINDLSQNSRIEITRLKKSVIIKHD